MTTAPQMKVIILAAGPARFAGTPRPILLQPLGDKWVIDYVVENGLCFVAPDDLYILFV